MSTNPPELSQLQNKLVESTGSSCRQVVVVFEDPRAGVQIKASTKPRKHTRVFREPHCDRYKFTCCMLSVQATSGLGILM
jgi:hypothetical protein